MVATPLAQSDRYIPAGVTRFYWVSTIVTLSSPLRSELDAGTDVTAEVAEAVGWRLGSDVHDVQGVDESFRSRVEGSLDVDDSRLLLYADRVGDDVSTLLSRGNAGHVVVLHGGDVAGSPMDVWPVRVASRARVFDQLLAATVIDLQFVVTAEPALDVAVPA